MRPCRSIALLALLGLGACGTGAPQQAAGCQVGALDDLAAARLLMAGVPTPVFDKGCSGKALAWEQPREGRRRAAMNGVLMALR